MAGFGNVLRDVNFLGECLAFPNLEKADHRRNTEKIVALGTSYLGKSEYFVEGGYVDQVDYLDLGG